MIASILRKVENWPKILRKWLTFRPGHNFAHSVNRALNRPGIIHDSPIVTLFKIIHFLFSDSLPYSHRRTYHFLHLVWNWLTAHQDWSHRTHIDETMVWSRSTPVQSKTPGKEIVVIELLKSKTRNVDGLKSSIYSLKIIYKLFRQFLGR